MQQYFSNLRQELPHHQQQANVDPVYRLARPLTRGISPAEINGLMTVLKLIQVRKTFSLLLTVFLGIQVLQAFFGKV
jgi:hypothetical protein